MIDKIPLDSKLHRFVRDITKDDTITVAEKKELLENIQKDGVSPEEQALLEALDAREEFTISSRGRNTTLKSFEFFFETPGLDLVAQDPHFKLEPGQSGEPVNALHTLIQELDFAFAPEADYGPKTTAWIQNFQNQHQLSPTGQVDQATLKALKQAEPRTPSLADIQTHPTARISLGQQGPAVQALNQAIKDIDHQFQPKEAKTFGPATEAFLKQFQSQHQLPSTGQLDAPTLKALQSAAPLNTPTLDEVKNSKGPLATTLHQGHKGESIDMLQILLGKLVDDFDSQSGVYDDLTAEAVEAFQSNNDLPVTGKVDAHTLKTMETATKLSDNQIYHPESVVIEDTEFANDYERVASIISNQMIDGECDIEASFEKGKTLLGAAQKVDKQMGSSNKCYTAVKKAVEKGLGLPYKAYRGKVEGMYGSYARTADLTYFKDYADHFLEITDLTRSDTQYLPPGAIMVYQPQNKSKAGHIGVADGKGHDVSDKTRNQRNVHTGADFKVYFPIVPLPPEPEPEEAPPAEASTP